MFGFADKTNCFLLKSEKVAQEKDKAVAEMEIEPVVNKIMTMTHHTAAPRRMPSMPWNVSMAKVHVMLGMSSE